MHERRRGRASEHRARVRRRQRAHVRWCLAINPSANKTTQKARARPRRWSRWAATLQTRAPMCSSRHTQCGPRARSAADSRPYVLQQTHAVRATGAALPRCLCPHSADLHRGILSGRQGLCSSAAQYKNYGTVHRDSGQLRSKPALPGPSGACSELSSERAARILFSILS